MYCTDRVPQLLLPFVVMHMQGLWPCWSCLWCWGFSAAAFCVVLAAGCPQARSLKDALVAMDRTITNIREFAAWHNKYSFISPGQRCCSSHALLLYSTAHTASVGVQVAVWPHGSLIFCFPCPPSDAMGELHMLGASLSVSILGEHGMGLQTTHNGMATKATTSASKRGLQQLGNPGRGGGALATHSTQEPINHWHRCCYCRCLCAPCCMRTSR